MSAHALVLSANKKSFFIYNSCLVEPEQPLYSLKKKNGQIIG